MYDEIKAILENEESKVFERYIILYRKFLTENNQENYLTFKAIIEVSNDVRLSEDESDESNPVIRKIGNQYYMLLKELVSSIARLNLIPEEFYERLYKSIFQSNIFPERETDRGIILYFLALKINGLPYFQAKNPIILDDEKFKEIIKEIKPELDKAMYMIKDRFDSLTEMASQLSDIADSLKSKEKKSVFWACVLQRFNKDGTDD